LAETQQTFSRNNKKNENLLQFPEINKKN